MTARRHIDPVVHEIAGFKGGIVTSLYVEVDGRHRPRSADVEKAFSHLARDARRQAQRRGPDAVDAVETDLGRIREWLGGSGRADARSLAFFSSSGDSFFRVVPLFVPVHDQVAVAGKAVVTQLVAARCAAVTALVAVVDREQARLFRCSDGQAVEHDAVLDERERLVDVRAEEISYLRHMEEQARRHARRAASAIVTEVTQWRPDRVFLAGPDNELLGAVEAHLPPDAVSLLAGRLPLTMDSCPEDVRRAVTNVGRDLDDEAEITLTRLLRERLGTRTAVAGWRDTLDALEERSVMTLLVARDLSVPGSRCTVCGRLDLPADRCGVCGSPVFAVDDLVEEAAIEAAAQNAAVRLCAPVLLEDFRGVCALLRYGEHRTEGA